MSMFFRRSGYGLLRAAVAVCALLGAGAVPAQEYKGPITLVVGYPAGGSADIGARILAEKLPPILGQPVIVENRAGAGGQIAARYVKAAPTNGSVLFFTNGHTVVTVPQILKAPGFDTRADLRPVSPFAGFELVLAVHPQTQAQTMKELLAYFTRTPGARNVAVPAPGSAPEFVVTRLAQLARADIQAVAYKGSAPAVQDVVGGQVPAAVLPVGDVLQYLKTGRLVAVAVTHATPLLPGVPAFADLGYAELGASDFLAVYAPAGLGDASVERINAAIQRVVAMPDVTERMLSYAMEPQKGSAAELGKRYEAARTTVQQLVKAVAYQPQ
ncbi:MAG: tripartite tricarboxylate transporter substrate-binding protein [Pseudomonadota bacterium]